MKLVHTSCNVLIFVFSVQWGGMKFSTGLFVGFLASGFASTIESVGDYYATARICGLTRPAKRAVSRGILMEGLATILGAVVGVGHATTSYSSTIGFIGITGVCTEDCCQHLISVYHASSQLQ